MEIAPINLPRSPKAIAAELNETLLSFHALRLERLGKDHSGLFSFYKQRLEEGQLINRRDVRIVELIDETLPRFETYHVLRAGLGETALLLAELGYRTIAYDPDRYRVAAIAAATKFLQRERDLAEDRIIVRLDVIPAASEPRIGTLCVAAHAVFGFDPKEDETIPGLFAGYDAVLFEPRTLCRMRENKRDQNRLLAAFRDNGFPEIVPFPALDLIFAAKSRAN